MLSVFIIVTAILLGCNEICLKVFGNAGAPTLGIPKEEKMGTPTNLSFFLTSLRRGRPLVCPSFFILMTCYFTRRLLYIKLRQPYCYGLLLLRSLDCDIPYAIAKRSQ